MCALYTRIVKHRSRDKLLVGDKLGERSIEEGHRQVTKHTIREDGGLPSSKSYFNMLLGEHGYQRRPASRREFLASV